ncbi:MAG: hypothetical protein MZV64_23835 [Ignavibacteriales bacterium]|nr:hypothetical protein [Ignavibacteriales bacterium]
MTDVSRQALAGRASFRVDPALGASRHALFRAGRRQPRHRGDRSRPQGKLQAGVAVTVQLVQVQWTSVRRAEGQGFYAWESQRKEVPAGEWSVDDACARRRSRCRSRRAASTCCARGRAPRADARRRAPSRST